VEDSASESARQSIGPMNKIPIPLTTSANNLMQVEEDYENDGQPRRLFVEIDEPLSQYAK